MQRLKETSRRYDDLVVSAFVDNSGVLRFYDGWAVCGKVETHNSPSAIEPYGGAMTGSGGVFRDVLGTGQGARVIASTDMFCFAPPDLPPADVPPGALAPDYLERGRTAVLQRYLAEIPPASLQTYPELVLDAGIVLHRMGQLPAAMARYEDALRLFAARPYPQTILKHVIRQRFAACILLAARPYPQRVLKPPRQSGS